MWPNGPELRRSRNRTGAVYRNRANWSKSNKSISFLGKLWKVESFGKGGKDGKNVKERGGGEGCDGSRSIGETGGGADGVGYETASRNT